MSSLRFSALVLVLIVSRVAAEQSLASRYGAESAITPAGMANRWVGGATSLDGARIFDRVGRRNPVTQQTTWSWELAGGPNTVGLLAKIWGKVTSVYSSPVTGAKWFYVDDGSRCVSDYGDVGVLVYSDTDVEAGAYVSVTGVTSVEQSFDSEERLVRVMTAQPDGVQVITDAPALERPLSDEFDGTAVKPGWVVCPGPGSMSLTTEPGWLALTAQPTSPQVVQLLQGEWDLEVRVRCPEAAQGEHGNAFILLNNTPYVNPSTASEVPGAGFVFRRWGGQAEVNLFDVKGIYLHHYVGPAVSDLLYLRVNQRVGILYYSYSFDGIVYCPQQWMKLPSTYLILYSSTGIEETDPSDTFTAYFDYVRFTPVNQGR